MHIAELMYLKSNSCFANWIGATNPMHVLINAATGKHINPVLKIGLINASIIQSQRGNFSSQWSILVLSMDWLLKYWLTHSCSKMAYGNLLERQNNDKNFYKFCLCELRSSSFEITIDTSLLSSVVVPFSEDTLSSSFLLRVLLMWNLLVKQEWSCITWISW